MNINDYIKLVEELNLLIEDIDTTRLEKDINYTKREINRLSKRINRYKDKQSSQLDYSKAIVDFYNQVKLSVRSATVKSEDTFYGREEFDVVGWDRDNYLILQKKDWDSKVALKLYYSELKVRRDQKGFIRLFYNEEDAVETGISNRQSSKEEVKFEFITLR
ncbi:MAG: hypothetical protein ACXACC_10095 [Promethearchaeota archaeon]|jgi:hypothetical protein